MRAAALLALTLSPPLIAAICWLVAGRVRRHGWLAHVAFLPVLLGSNIALGCAAITPVPLGEEAAPGDGFAFLPGVATAALTVLAYAVALIASIAWRPAHRPSSAPARRVGLTG